MVIPRPFLERDLRTQHFPYQHARRLILWGGAGVIAAVFLLSYLFRLGPELSATVSLLVVAAVPAARFALSIRSRRDLRALAQGERHAYAVDGTRLWVRHRPLGTAPGRWAGPFDLTRFDRAVFQVVHPDGVPVHLLLLLERGAQADGRTVAGTGIPLHPGYTTGGTRPGEDPAGAVSAALVTVLTERLPAAARPS